MGTEGFLIQFTMALSKGHREVSPPGLPLLNSECIYAGNVYEVEGRSGSVLIS